VVYAGRRPPPQAARRVIDRGEHDDRLSQSDQSTAKQTTQLLSRFAGEVYVARPWFQSD
jgi:hypothetical protein